MSSLGFVLQVQNFSMKELLISQRSQPTLGFLQFKFIFKMLTIFTTITLTRQCTIINFWSKTHFSDFKIIMKNVFEIILFTFIISVEAMLNTVRLLTQ